MIVVWGAMSVSFGVSRSLRRFGYKSHVMPGKEGRGEVKGSFGLAGVGWVGKAKRWAEVYERL